MRAHQQHPCASDRGVSHVPASEQSDKTTLETLQRLARYSQNSEDLAQHMAEKVLVAAPKCENRNGAKDSTFAHKVAHNALKDFSKREHRLKSIHEFSAHEVGNIDDPHLKSDVQPGLANDRFYTPDQYAEYADTVGALFEVAADLPPRQQMLLERHCLGAGDSIKALAEEFHCTVQSLYQARKALFQKLDCAGVSAPQ